MHSMFIVIDGIILSHRRCRGGCQEGREGTENKRTREGNRD